MITKYLVELELKTSVGFPNIRAALLGPTVKSDVLQYKIEAAALRKQKDELIDLSMGPVIVEIYVDDQLTIRGK
jgi:hypothetical protein